MKNDVNFQFLINFKDDGRPTYIKKSVNVFIKKNKIVKKCSSFYRIIWLAAFTKRPPSGELAMVFDERFLFYDIAIARTPCSLSLRYNDDIFYIHRC